MNKKLETIDNSFDHECYKCLGLGYIGPSENVEKCDTCNGNGTWKETHYIHIYEIDGQKVAFDSDFMGI